MNTLLKMLMQRMAASQLSDGQILDCFAIMILVLLGLVAISMWQEGQSKLK